jgi:K+-transporting ATPase ATPase A chain
MSWQNWLQLGALVGLIGVSAPLLGAYLARVFRGGPAPGERVFGPLERLCYRLAGIDERGEQTWQAYARSLLIFSGISVAALYLLLRLQGSLPLNPSHATSATPALAFNTAISFVTNTNWQNYAGETGASHLVQMSGLALQNFLSAAVGIAVVVALVRGLTRRKTDTIGNFWVDLVRTTTRVLVPLAFVLAIALASQGLVQNLHGFTHAHTVAGATQSIPGGPVASQEAIKELGTNGGGFYNANSAHPFENPTPLTNLLEIWALLVIPFSLPFAFGRLVGNKRQGWTLFAAMFLLWGASVGIATHYEVAGNPRVQALGATGSNMEGKEIRYGSPASALFAASTTSTSTGAVNSAHDSFTPLGGGVLRATMRLSEVSPGGTGSGLYGMVVFAILAVFIAGLMVGRTPEYLGKKVQALEMKLVVLYLLVVPLVILLFAGASVVLHGPRSALLNHGAHGLTEMVYAFTSAANNNGSAFAGIGANTYWYNVTLALAMLAGRFGLMVIVLALAGSLARKQSVPESAGTFPTATPIFAGLLLAVILIVVLLTYAPVLALGGILEHLAL